jgi:hypothetical protein
VTPYDLDASFWGAVIGVTVPTVNYIGCVEALDTTSAGTSCAAEVAAAEGCAGYACTANCPVTDDPSWNAFSTCTDSALAGACTGYKLRALACLVAEQGDGGTPIATICLPGMTAEDHYLAIAKHFCAGE